VQAAREAARRAGCVNNMKQIMLAAQLFHDANNTLPPGASPSPSNASLYVYLLPYLEQKPRYDAFNFSFDFTGKYENQTARAGDLSVFMCPSDPPFGLTSDPGPGGTPGVGAGYMGRSNYPANLGINAWTYETQGNRIKDSRQFGVFATLSATPLQSITDGQSNTVAFSELKRGPLPAATGATIAEVPLTTWGTAAPNNPSDLVPPAACATSTVQYPARGLQFQNGFILICFYTHSVTPNTKNPDCTVSQTLDQAHLAARSYHPGGVNAAFCDGSVRFIKDSISLDVWGRLGTRSGGEVISSEGY
jgi:prepilin-type processing-associated H-X9-DG protein